MTKELKGLSRRLQKIKEGKERIEELYLILFRMNKLNYKEDIALALDTCNEFLEGYDNSDIRYLFYEEIKKYLKEVLENIENMKKENREIDKYIDSIVKSIKTDLDIKINIVSNEDVLRLVNMAKENGASFRAGECTFVENNTLVKIKGVGDLSELDNSIVQYIKHKNQ